ncbi:MAG: hypothetical protein ACYC6F_11430 [Longimicrobiales bacterium]
MGTRSAQSAEPPVAAAAVAFALLANFERATLWVVTWCVAAALLAG